MMMGPSGGDPLERLGRFQVLAHIATGGMGSVYRAFDPKRCREVALKILPAELADRPDLLERFRREAQHGIKLRHENIVTLYEMGEKEGIHYLVMEYVDGTDLGEYLRERGPIAPEKARKLLVQLAQALEHAHAQGIVHRDIKPSNILIARRNGRKIAKLADLGLSRDMHDHESRVTRDGTTVGTIDYISPEQARDSGTADIRSDIYSLGCTFFHILTGRPPFAEGGLAERIYKHCEVEPPPVRRWNPQVSDDLVAILKRMLAKNPAQRYQTPTELVHALLAEPKTPPPAEPLPKTVNLHMPARPAPAPRTALRPETSAVLPAGQRTAAAQFDWAREVLAVENYRDAIGVLLGCCEREPGTLQFRQTLREAQQEWHANVPRPRWRCWLAALLPRLRLWQARQQQKHQEALAQGERVLTQTPWDVGTQIAMAEEADAAGLFEVAVWLLEQVLEEAPTSARPRRSLARVYEKRKDFRKAIACWEQVAQIVPGDHEAGQKLRDLAALQTMERNRYAEVVANASPRRRSGFKRD